MLFRRRLVIAGTTAMLLLLLNTIALLHQVSDADSDVTRNFDAEPQGLHATQYTRGNPPVWSAPDAPPLPNSVKCDQHDRHSRTEPTTMRRSRDPHPDPRAIVMIGRAVRFTVLTERVVRIEHRGPESAFDDRASFAIIHRRLDVPAFTAGLASCILLDSAPQCLVIETAQLRLEFAAPSSAQKLERSETKGWIGAWTPSLLTNATLRVRIAMPLPLSESVWWPGRANPRQLPGTIRTLDKADGATELRCDALSAQDADEAHCVMGVISRDGWALVDDTRTARFDGSEQGGGGTGTAWDWAAPVDEKRVALRRAAALADGDSRCAGWAKGGECDKNAAFMLSGCKATCELAAKELARRRNKRQIFFFFHGPGSARHC